MGKALPHNAVHSPSQLVTRFYTFYNILFSKDVATNLMKVGDILSMNVIPWRHKCLCFETVAQSGVAKLRL